MPKEQTHLIQKMEKNTIECLCEYEVNKAT